MLPFADGSVDLLTAASAAHWFDPPRFLAEASRVLKPRGCIALLGYSDHGTRIHYQNCGERLSHIYEEVGVKVFDPKNRLKSPHKYNTVVTGHCDIHIVTSILKI